MHTGWITGDAGRPAFPARLVLTVSFVLSPGSDALLPPSPCGWLMRAPGRTATSPQRLTHRLRASGPHDFSVRGRPRRTFKGWRVLTPDANEAAVTAPCRAADRNVSRGLPALSSRRAPALPRPPHPGLRIVTIANAPLTSRDGHSDTTKPKFGKQEYFSLRFLTRCFARPARASEATADLQREDHDGRQQTGHNAREEIRRRYRRIYCGCLLSGG